MRTVLGALTAAILAVGAPLAAQVALAQDVPAASSTEQEVTDGLLQWGIREEWRNYIGVGPGTAGPGATGEIVGDGIATVGAAGITTWSAGSGTVDLENGTGTISYEGLMTFRGHPGESYSGGWGMTQTYKDPQITLTSTTTATLSFEMTQTSAIASWPTLPSDENPGPRYEIVNLTFDEGDLDDGQVTTTSATLTETGAYIWNNYGAYVPGVQMDGVTFSLNAEPIAQQQPTTTTLTVSAATVEVGETVTLMVNVEPAISGQISFKQDGETLQTTTANGTASYRTDALKVGDHSFTAEFEPDDAAYAASASSPVSIVVEDPNASDTTTEGSLQWGVKESFRSYVLGSIAHGTITPSAGAAQDANNGIFRFPQAASGTEWNGSTGTVQYAGVVNFSGHAGVLNVNLTNPVIEVLNANEAQLKVPFGANNDMIVLATINLDSGTKTQLDGDAVRFSSARTFLADSGEQYFSDPSGQGSTQPFYVAGTELDRITFTVGKGSDINAEEQTPPTPKTPVTTNEDAPDPAATSGGSEVAGSLTWSISDYFTQYTTQKSGASCPTSSKHCAGGTIETSGVDSGWLFPQAAGGSWNAQTQTGSVTFSGVVAFKGYGMTMFQVANPVITVYSATSATLQTGYSGSHGPSSVELDLSAATKTVSDSGAVTWSNVPVQGGLMGISEGQEIDFDPLTFTVGQPSTASFGSTQQGGEEETSYEAAATAPTTSGLDVLTKPERIVEGGRIQVAADGFEPNDDGVLVVLYKGADGQSEPIVLAENAKADESGRVNWSGTLPEKGTGPYVMTLQGSAAAGANIEILAAETTAAGSQPGSGTDAAGAESAGATIAPNGIALWEWWVTAGGLCAIAVCTSILARRQWAAVFV